MFNRFTSMAAVLLLTLFVVTGCGDEDNGTDGDNGDVQATDSCLDAAVPDQECEDFEDCPYVVCICEEDDGNPERHCSGGTCQDPEMYCSNSCDEWTGDCELN